MSLVWLELLELMKGRSGVALAQFVSSSSGNHRKTGWCQAGVVVVGVAVGGIAGVHLPMRPPGRAAEQKNHRGGRDTLNAVVASTRQNMVVPSLQFTGTDEDHRRLSGRHS
jgi:hypothetical protein